MYQYQIPDDPRIGKYPEETFRMLYGDSEPDEDEDFIDEYGVRHVNNG